MKNTNLLPLLLLLAGVAGGGRIIFAWSLKLKKDAGKSHKKKNFEYGNNVIVKSATIDDIDQMVQILDDAFGDDNGYGRLALQNYFDFVPSLWYDETSSEEYIVAYDADTHKVLGVVAINTFNRHCFGQKHSCSYVSDLAVDWRHRRKGIATMLLQKAEEIALKWWESHYDAFLEDYDYDYAEELHHNICLHSLKSNKYCTRELCTRGLRTRNILPIIMMLFLCANKSISLLIEYYRN